MASTPTSAAPAAPGAPPPPPAPPRAVGLVVTSTGEKGKYTFRIQVVSDKGCGIKCQINIIEGTVAIPLKSTDEEGFFEHTANPFNEEEQEFFFGVVGTNLQYETVLEGPEKKQKQKTRIKPIAKAGFWANVCNVTKHR